MNSPHLCLPTLLFFLLISASTAIVRAELPPQAYRAWQQQSPEALVIWIHSVKTDKTDLPNGRRINVEIEAEVKQVIRTKTGLAAGQMIRIVYTQFQPIRPIAGPSEVPVLEQGRTYPAFLSANKRNDHYVPAAGGFSFQKVE